MSARRLDTARALVASLAMVLLTLGCGSDGAISREDQGPAGDAGAIDLGVFLDGAVVDQGVPTGLLFPADSARFAPFLAAAQDAFPPVADDRPAPWTTCYASASGCDSAPCSLLASCCVASGRCAELFNSPLRWNVEQELAAKLDSIVLCVAQGACSAEELEKALSVLAQHGLSCRGVVVSNWSSARDIYGSDELNYVALSGPAA